MPSRIVTLGLPLQAPDAEAVPQRPPPLLITRCAMRSVFLLAVASFLALTGSAHAADGEPAWNWTGCFGGGHTGGVWAESSEWIVSTPGGAHFGQSLGDHGLSGWIGGVQGGCDYQFSDGFVVGIQGDYDFADAVGSHASAQEFGVAYHSKVKGLASASVRLGYAWDRFLGYIKGGAAWERTDYSASTIVVGTAYTASVTRPGWTIGIGGEYAITRFLSGFVEYGYSAFGTRQIGLTPQIAGLRRASVDIKETASVLRVGLSFRFRT